MKLAFSLFIALMLFGCGPGIIQQRQNISSAHIGCPSDIIEISNQSNYSWTAKCKGKTFFCTVAPSASCKEELK
jgi:hypothetical protein